MLALLGLATIALLLAAILTKKMSPLVALIAIPIAAALIGGFGMETSKFIVGGITKIAPVAGMFVFAILFMRGHNQPGGGFVAGLVMSVAFILQYMVAGTQWVEAQMSLRPLRWMGTGLLCATLTGLGSLLWGYPFLTTHTAHFSLPVLGEIHVASALFFDIGVFAVVVGATLLILTALAHQSVRAHRPALQSKTGAA